MFLKCFIHITHNRSTVHAHQPKILIYPQNENFISLQLFMRIQLIFFVFGKSVFLKLMDVG
ncbi:hypothetical protein COL91_03555 [Bacillus pseudomycoides]|nr:hypothetical protein COO02_13520 [Bacillus pseudomycoides]PEI90037.1 hypothetical protein CN679_18885 [Bacillus pseudomycoides]PGA93868.1 hypothetical protein COL91_03555 [Bacillus pseudomycoides]PHF35421.1 hypothetical protein COF72_25795 [Bacillus pseudomycoides]